MSEPNMEVKKRNRRGLKTQSGLTAPKKLKVLITIVSREKTEFYLDILEGFDVNMQTVTYGKGTAPSDMLHYLGLNESKKAIIISIVKEEKLKGIFAAYEERCFKTKNGKGIAFTFPISSVIGVAVYQFLSNSIEGRKGDENE